MLGLVCITHSDEIRYRVITRKRLLSLPVDERSDVLMALYRANLATLGRALDYCVGLGIRLYRIPSAIFPFADEPIGIELLVQLQEDIAAVGRRARKLDMRLVMHPDQFVVLSSDSEAVVANSIKILVMHARILDALEQPREAWATIEIHGGKRDRNEKLVDVVRNLPHAVKSRLALENDEISYGAEAMLSICHAASVPMVFDAHHHVCFERLDSYEDPSVADLTEAAADTWPRPDWQMVHISNGLEAFNDRRHSDEITMMPSAYARVPWIEVEAKGKERAIRRLQVEWHPVSRSPRH